MENQYHVFIQWNANTRQHKNSDGGLEQIKSAFDTVGEANRAAADWLFYDNDNDNDYYWYPWGGAVSGLQLGTNDKTVVIDFNSTEPASVNFGYGTIYVAGVES